MYLESYFDNFNNNLMTHSFTASASAPEPFYHAPVLRKEANTSTPAVKYITLRSGTLTSITHNGILTDLQSIEFKIEGLSRIQKETYRPSSSKIGLRDWLKSHSGNKYDLLVIEEGEKIADITEILIDWSQTSDGMYQQNMVIYSAYGHQGIMTISDENLKVDNQGKIVEQYLY